MGKYDGPSIFKQQYTNKTTKITQKNAQSSKNQPVAADKLSNHVSPQHKQPADYLEDDQPLTVEQGEAYQPIFRATEIPSPMFGYSKKQRERMGEVAEREEFELEWNYQRLKSHMTQKMKHKDFIITEECLSPRTISKWKKHTPSIEQSSRPKKNQSSTSKLSTSQSKQRSSGSKKKKH